MYELADREAHAAAPAGTDADAGKSTRTQRLAPRATTTPPGTGGGGPAAPTQPGEPIKPPEPGPTVDDPFGLHLPATAAEPGPAEHHADPRPADAPHGPHHGHRHHGHPHHAAHGDAAAHAPTSASGPGFGAWLSGLLGDGPHAPASSPATAPSPTESTPSPATAARPAALAPARLRQPNSDTVAPAPPGARFDPALFRQIVGDDFDHQVPQIVPTLVRVAPAHAPAAVALLRAALLARAAELGREHPQIQVQVAAFSDGTTLYGHGGASTASGARLLERGDRLGTVAGQHAALAYATLDFGPDGRFRLTLHAAEIGEHTLVAILGRHAQTERRQTAADTQLQSGALLGALGQLQGGHPPPATR